MAVTVRSSRLIAGAIATMLGAALLAVSGPSVASATPGNADNVTICHATSATKNPYTTNTVDPASITKKNGHGSHTGPVFAEGVSNWGDIIPPFGDYPGLNWSSAGQAIWNNGCQPVSAPETTPTTPTPPTTPPAVDWNWQYQVSCNGVSGTNPNGPIDSVDSNIRIKNLTTGEIRSFNYHPNTGGDAAFTFTLANYGVPASWEHFEIQWVQVNGTNYHWEGATECGNAPVTTTEPTTTEPTTTEPTDTTDPTTTVPTDNTETTQPNEPVVPAVPAVTESQCVDHVASTPAAQLPADGNHITYGYFYGPNDRGFTAKATLDAGYTWGNLAGTGWVDKGDGTAALHRLWAAAPDCNEYVTPVLPELSETCSNTDGQWTNTIVAPASTDQIAYKVHDDGLLYAAVQQSVKGYTFFDTAQLPAGWAPYDAKAQYLVFTPTYQNGECLASVDLVTPTVSQPSCDGDTHVAGSFEVPASTPQVTYSRSTNGKLIAKARAGYQLTGTLPAGWVASSFNRAVYTPVYDAAPLCPVELVEPVVVQPTCDVAGSVTLPTDTDKISYYFHPVNGKLVAKAAAGYRLADTMPAGWTASSVNRAVFTPTYGTVVCDSEITPADPSLTLSDECGIDDVLTVPADDAEVTYVQKWNEEQTHVQVVARAAAGYYFNTNGEHKNIRTWEFDVRTVDNGGIEPCVVDPTGPTDSSTATSTSTSTVTSPSTDTPIEGDPISTTSSDGPSQTGRTTVRGTAHSSSAGSVNSSSRTPVTSSKAPIAASSLAASVHSSPAGSVSSSAASVSSPAAAAAQPLAGPPSATAKTGETGSSTAYLLLGLGLLLMLSALWSRRRGNHAA